MTTQDVTQTRFEALPEAVQNDLALIIFWCEHYARQEEMDAVDRLTDWFAEEQVDERATLTARIAKRDARIASLESQLAHSQREHDKQAQLLYEKNQRIAELEAGITQIDVAWDTASRAVSELEHELEQLQAQAGTWLPVEAYCEIYIDDEWGTPYKVGVDGDNNFYVLNRSTGRAVTIQPDKYRLFRWHGAGQDK